MSQGERRLAAIAFTDMVGYTAIGQRNESLSLALVQEHKALVRSVLARHHGREVKTMGDAFLLEFPNVLDAVRCTYDIQRAIREFNFSLPEDRRVHLRIGIHMGDVLESAGDISGDAVNIASRIESLAEDGGVCVTREVYAQVSNKFEIPMVGIGSKLLKNLNEPVEVYKMRMPWEEEASHPRQPKSKIAVLPLSNISSDSNDAYIAERLTEELISKLSEISELSVISKTSTAQYKERLKSIREIGKELDAGTILEGSVRKAGNRIRVTIQVIDAATDRHNWAETYDRELSDIFAIQSDIAGRLADSLKIRLLQGEERRVGNAYTRDVEAHTLYLRGLSHLSRYAYDEKTKGLGLLEEAVAKDPLFAAAHAALSEGYTYAAGETMPREIGFSRAKEHALKAIELDEGLADGHAALGILSMQSYADWRMAPIELKRAIELNPSNASAHWWLGLHLADREGDSEGALRELKRAEELNPLSALIKFAFGYVLFNTRRYSDSLAKFREAGDNYLAHIYRGFVESLAAKCENALTEMTSAERESVGLPFALGALGYVMGKCGMRDDAFQMIARSETGDRWGWSSPYGIALVLLGLEEYEGVLNHLDEAAANKDENLILFNPGVSPLFDPVHASPRFQGLLKRVGLTIRAPA